MDKKQQVSQKIWKSISGVHRQYNTVIWTENSLLWTLHSNLFRVFTHGILWCFSCTINKNADTWPAAIPSSTRSHFTLGEGKLLPLHGIAHQACQ